MRILGNSPFFPRSPWLWLPYNAVTEADVRTAMPEAIGDVGSAPARLFLEPVAPNPVSGEIVLRYTLPAAGRVRLAVYDVAGRFIASPVDALEVEGRHVVRWDGRDARGSAMPAGTYFARFSFSAKAFAVISSSFFDVRA